MRYFDKYEKDGAYHHKWYGGDEWYNELVDVMVLYAKGFVIDMGCGDGLLSKKLLESGRKVEGYDSSSAGLELAGKSVKGVKFINADINELRLPDNYCDTMCCLNIIEHLENPRNLAGIFNDSVKSQALIITDRKRPEGMGRYHFKEYDEEEIEEMFKGNDTARIKLKTELSFFIKVTKK